MLRQGLFEGIRLIRFHGLMAPIDQVLQTIHDFDQFGVITIFNDQVMDDFIFDSQL